MSRYECNGIIGGEEPECVQKFRDPSSLQMGKRSWPMVLSTQVDSRCILGAHLPNNNLFNLRLMRNDAIPQELEVRHDSAERK